MFNLEMKWQRDSDDEYWLSDGRWIYACYYERLQRFDFRFDYDVTNYEWHVINMKMYPNFFEDSKEVMLEIMQPQALVVEGVLLT